MTECSFGITGKSRPTPRKVGLSKLMSVCRPYVLLIGKDFVLLASDQSAGRSIIKMKSDENKIRQLSPSLCMAYGGEPGKQAACSPGYIYNEELMSASFR
jgi:hypothetical protein